MKKKITLLIIIIITCGLESYSQSLSNTTWSVFDASGDFFFYFNFRSDTMSYSGNNDFYTKLSTYKENGNNFTINDLSAEFCLGSTGEYTFQIQNDTLQFYLVADNCTSRKNTFLLFTWVRLSTSIQSENLLSKVKIYPNPAIDMISIQTNNNIRNGNYIIYDQLGKQVLIGKLIGENTTVDISHLYRGIYFLQFEKYGNEIIKMIKE